MTSRRELMAGFAAVATSSAFAQNSPREHGASLAPSLESQHIQKTADGYPVLDTSLQTSVKGLYMAGVIAEKTLGPTLRFVTGTSNAGPRLAAGVAAKRFPNS